jgi:transcriptional regulator with XRE-family HTH domain
MCVVTTRSMTMTEDPGSPSEREEESAAYARAVGACLRRVRQQLRLSLQAVETMSGQEFKASVLGAYERGERAISVPRLQRLAILYDVPVDLLLPAPERRGEDGEQGGPARGGRLDLDARINAISGPERELLRRFVRMIQAQRRDGGQSPAIRSEDLRAIELLLGSPTRPEEPRDR